MENAELIALYNPANAQNLSADQIAAMRGLTNEQLDVLAGTYPNTPTQRPYLVLYDERIDEKRQLYPLSTWQNLRNVRKFNGMANLKPFTFRVLFSPSTAKTVTQAAGGKSSLPKAQQVDLSAKEAADELRRTLAQKKPATGSDQGNQAKATPANRSPRKRNVPASTTTANQQEPAPETGEQKQGDNIPADQTEQSIA